MQTAENTEKSGKPGSKNAQVYAYFQPIIRRLREFEDGERAILGDAIMQAVLDPAPAQRYLADFLQGKLPLLADQAKERLAESGVLFSPAQNLIIAIAKSNQFMPRDKRMRASFQMAMTRDEFEDSIPAILNEDVHNVAAILQLGVSNYLKELSFVLAMSCGPLTEIVRGRVLSGINANSIWRELLPFMARSFTDKGDLSATYELARKNAFESTIADMRDNGRLKIKKCPARRWIRDILATDFEEGEDGALTVKPAPNPSALPVFIYRKLKEQAALTVTPSPAPAALEAS